MKNFLTLTALVALLVLIAKVVVPGMPDSDVLFVVLGAGFVVSTAYTLGYAQGQLSTYDRLDELQRDLGVSADQEQSA